MQIRSARPNLGAPRFAPSPRSLSESVAPRESASSAFSADPSPRAARAAYSRATRRLANRLQGPPPADVAAQPRSLFRRALQRIRNTLLGAG